MRPRRRVPMLALCLLLARPPGAVAEQVPMAGAADYQAALAMIKAGKSKLALPLLWKAASDYHEAALWVTMGYCYFEAGEVEKSFAAYGIGLFYDPGNEEILKWFSDNGREPYSGVLAVNWKRSREKVSGYNIYLQLFKNGPYFRVNDLLVKKAPYIISGLAPEREYYVRLSALSDEKPPVEGEISKPQMVFSFHGKLRQRHETRYEVRKGGKVELEWPKSQDPWLLGYNIYLQLPGGARFERVNHAEYVKSNKYLIKGLAYGVSYIVRIVAVLEATPPREKVIDEFSVDIPLP